MTIIEAMNFQRGNLFWNRPKFFKCVPSWVDFEAIFLVPNRRVAIALPGAAFIVWCGWALVKLASWHVLCAWKFQLKKTQSDLSYNYCLVASPYGNGNWDVVNPTAFCYLLNQAIATFLLHNNSRKLIWDFPGLSRNLDSRLRKFRGYLFILFLTKVLKSGDRESSWRARGQSGALGFLIWIKGCGFFA